MAIFNFKYENLVIYGNLGHKLPRKKYHGIGIKGVSVVQDSNWCLLIQIAVTDLSFSYTEADKVEMRRQTLLCSGAEGRKVKQIKKSRRRYALNS